LVIHFFWVKFFAKQVNLNRVLNRKHAQVNEKASKEFPKNWRAHYSLANTYFGLGKFESATREYDICIRICNGDRVVKQCCLAKIAIEKYIVQSNVALSNLQENSKASRDLLQAEKDRNRSRIKSETNKQVALIRKQAEQKIKAEKSCSQLILRYPDGTMKLGISPQREAQIKREAEMQCQILRRRSRKSIENIR